MLAFLVSVQQKVTQFFTALYNKVVWMVTGGYIPLYQFVAYFYGAVSEYWSYRQHDVRHYSQTARPKTDHIAVWNYSKTEYSALSSFWDIMNTRQQWLPTLRGITQPGLYFVKGIVDFGKNQMFSLINTPVAKVNYALGKGADLITEYEYRFRDKVAHLVSKQPTLDALARDDRASKIITWVDYDEPVIKAMVAQNRLFTSKLNGSVDKLADLSRDDTYNSLKELSKLDPQKLKELVDKSVVSASPISDQNLKRLIYLVDTKWKFLVSMLENPSEYTLRMIEPDFFAWFVWLLYVNLTEVEK